MSKTKKSNFGAFFDRDPTFRSNHLNTVLSSTDFMVTLKEVHGGFS